jgi:hypothetical protein
MPKYKVRKGGRYYTSINLADKATRKGVRHLDLRFGDEVFPVRDLTLTTYPLLAMVTL